MKNTRQPPRSMSLHEATAVTPLDRTTYRVELAQGFSNGTVPNGGYVASCLMSAAAAHLGTAARGQADVITAHFEFVRRTEVGPAVITIEEVKLGRRLSTLHVSLYQGGLMLDRAPWYTADASASASGTAGEEAATPSPPPSRRAVVAYLNCGNLEVERGLTLPTGYDFRDPPNGVPRPPRPADLIALARDGHDGTWQRLQVPDRLGGLERRALHNMEYYFPRAGQKKRSVIDVWVRLAEPSGGRRFTNAALGYVADSWPYVVEAYRGAAAESSGDDDDVAVVREDDVFWFPTVVMNLDVKKALPAAGPGAEWLCMRVEAKQIMRGRLDIEVVILDEEDKLVAICHHVNLIVGGERNLKKRAKL
ncbi:thioesterase family protein [Microdochium nivale]|nr:thioesterase family protein [Microdochium nivale]